MQKNSKIKTIRYYNMILNQEDRYDKLIKINNLIMNQTKSLIEGNSSKSFEPIGKLSKQLYYRMNELDSINPYSDIFNDRCFKTELDAINAFYYYSIKIINIDVFNYFEIKSMTKPLTKEEDYAYRFYDTLIKIFLNKTDSFINKISNYIADNKCKKIIK